MPNIDTSAIEGFDAMTPEQKVEALLKVDVPEKVDLTGYVKKDLYDKTASDLAAAKKQVKDKMTDGEKALATALEEVETLKSAMAQGEQERKELQKKVTVADHTARYLALGYDEKLAKSTAEALFDGDMDKVFANQQAHNAAMEKKLRAEIMKDTPGPNGAGGGGDQKSAAQSVAERIGSARAEATKNANSILGKYLGGNQFGS